MTAKKEMTMGLYVQWHTQVAMGIALLSQRGARRATAAARFQEEWAAMPAELRGMTFQTYFKGLTDMLRLMGKIRAYCGNDPDLWDIKVFISPKSCRPLH